MISPMGFAVAAETNKIYAWSVRFQLPEASDNPEEVDARDERLDGVDEESKDNVAQIVRDPELLLTQAC